MRAVLARLYLAQGWQVGQKALKLGPELVEVPSDKTLPGRVDVLYNKSSAGGQVVG